MSSQSNQKTRLAELEREHAELVASLPKHSIKAAQLMRIEELEDEIAALRAALGVEAGGADLF
ncbi:MAG: hypothetical protein JXA10_11925 [Anaerolineae bacterium]|nr:hypothetical protein [Anaerolineae bacterium]